MENPAAQSLFHPAALRPGDILHSYTDGVFGRLIRKAIGSRGSHDALVVDAASGGLCVAESLPRGGALTPLGDYEARMRAGKTTVLVLRIPGASVVDGCLAAQWMESNIMGTPYDFWAFPRLWLKAKLGDWFPSQAGKEWAWYCTESVRAAWRMAGFDPWAKNNPTPRTTEKRLQAGALTDVSRRCLTPEGQRYLMGGVIPL